MIYAFLAGVVTGAVTVLIVVWLILWRSRYPASKLYHEASKVYRAAIAAVERGDLEEFKRLRTRHAELQEELKRL